jgi:arylsulfatase A-like enzyme
MTVSPSRPNIFFILSDQQRWDTLGCYGQSLDVTPHLDRMAAKGVRFEYAFTPQPLCGPARACLLTGRHASQNGCYRNGIPLQPGQATIATLLSEQGYETSYIGKWHMAGSIDFYEDRRKSTESYDDAPIPPHRRGGFKDNWLAADLLEFTSHGYGGHVFDAGMQRVDFPKGRYRPDVLTDFAIEHLRTRDRSRPLFLFLSYLEPHHQNDTGRYEAPPGSSKRWIDFITPGDLENKKGNWRRDYADYLACIHSLDENVGRLVAEMERLEMSDNTLIIYTSDHGNHFKTRNSEYKRSAHEASIRIPLLLSGPGFSGGQVVTTLVTLLDLAPTLLAAAGAVAPDWMPGCTLQQFVSDARSDVERDILLQISESTLGRALRTRRWKYSVCNPLDDGWRNPSNPRYVEEALYDLDDDPYEKHNLVRDPAYGQIRAELRERLLVKMGSIGEPSAEILTAYPLLRFQALKLLGTIQNTSWLYWKVATQYLR